MICDLGLFLDLLSYVEIFINTQNVIHGIFLQFFASLRFYRTKSSPGAS